MCKFVIIIVAHLQASNIIQNLVKIVWMKSLVHGVVQDARLIDTPSVY